MALDGLDDEGELVVIVPPSLPNGINNMTKRQRLLDENRLETVITLPQHTFAPFQTNQSSCLIHIKKGSGRGSTWLGQLQNDGFKLRNDPKCLRDIGGEWPTIFDQWESIIGGVDSVKPCGKTKEGGFIQSNISASDHWSIVAYPQRDKPTKDDYYRRNIIRSDRRRRSGIERSLFQHISYIIWSSMKNISIFLVLTYFAAYSIGWL